MTHARVSGDEREIRPVAPAGGSDSAPRLGVSQLGGRVKVAIGGAVVAGAFSLGLVAGGGFSAGVEAQSSLTGRAEFATLEEDRKSVV